jgi:hypothetical protein
MFTASGKRYPKTPKMLGNGLAGSTPNRLRQIVSTCSRTLPLHWQLFRRKRRFSQRLPSLHRPHLHLHVQLNLHLLPNRHRHRHVDQDLVSPKSHSATYQPEDLKKPRRYPRLTNPPWIGRAMSPPTRARASKAISPPTERVADILRRRISCCGSRSARMMYLRRARPRSGGEHDLHVGWRSLFLIPSSR